MSKVKRYIYDKYKKIVGFIKSIAFVIDIIIKNGPIYSLLIFLQTILNALMPAIQVIVVADFVNRATDIVNHKSNIEGIYVYLLYLMLIIGFTFLSEKLVALLYIKLTNRLRESLGEEYINKYSTLAYENLENSDVADLIERVIKNPETEFKETFENVMKFLSININVISIMCILITQVWWIAVGIFICAIPLFYLSFKSGKNNYQMNREMTKYIRRYGYIGEVLTSRDSVEERTLFGYSKELNNIWKNNYEKARKMIFVTELKWWAKMKLGSVFTIIFSFIVTIVLIYPVVEGHITIGMFMALINANYSLVSRLSEELTVVMDKLAQKSEFINDVKKFKSLKDDFEASIEPLKREIEFKSLEFRNVFFKYPNTDNYILKGISFLLEEGKHYSFVGINGSGKTTITKLITGLYKEFEGEILINGKSINNYSSQELKSISAVAFQDFAKYFVSVKDNILLGDINNMNKTSDEEVTD